MPGQSRQIDATITGSIACRDSHHFDTTPGAGCNGLCIFAQKTHDTGADCAKTRNTKMKSVTVHETASACLTPCLLRNVLIARVA